MSTYQCVISVITGPQQQYIAFNILGLLPSQRRPKAIKGRINALSQNTVTALLSLDIGGLVESHFSTPLFSYCVAHKHTHTLYILWRPSLTICSRVDTLPLYHTHNTPTFDIFSHFPIFFFHHQHSPAQIILFSLLVSSYFFLYYPPLFVPPPRRLLLPPSPSAVSLSAAKIHTHQCQPHISADTDSAFI